MAVEPAQIDAVRLDSLEHIVDIVAHHSEVGLEPRIAAQFRSRNPTLFFKERCDLFRYLRPCEESPHAFVEK